MKRTAPLKAHKLDKGDKAQPGRTKTASTSKIVGLNEDMIKELSKDPEMHSLIKLHEQV